MRGRGRGRERERERERYENGRNEKVQKVEFMLLVTRGGPIRGGRACVCMLRTRQAGLFLFVPREKRKGADFSIHVACHFYDFNSWKLLLRSRALVKGFVGDVLPESLIFPPSKGILFRERRETR